MRLYISGPVTGRDNLNIENFENAADKLIKAGYSVVIPHWFTAPSMSWEIAMKRCIETMMHCDGVALLPDWTISKGAIIECQLANSIKMQVATVDGWLDLQ